MSSRPRVSKKKKTASKSTPWALWISGGFAAMLVVGLIIWGVAQLASPEPATTQAVEPPKALSPVPTTPAEKLAPEFEYVVQLDRKQSQGATAANNLAVTVARIRGSGMPTPQLHAQFEKKLGVKVPDERSTRVNQESQALIQQRMGTQYRPWSPQDYPDVVNCLNQAQEDLDLLAAASTICTHFYWPLFSMRTEEALRYSPAASIDASYDETLSAAMSLLSVRSLMHFKKGDLPSAIEDALASLRLGNLLSQGRLSLDQVTSQNRTHALRALLPVVNSQRVTADQLAEIESVLKQAPLNPVTEKDVVDVERTMMLDMVAAIPIQGIEVLTPEAESPRQAIPRSALSADRIDYDEARKVVNRYIDQVQAELDKNSPFRTYLAAIQSIEAEVKTAQANRTPAKDRTDAGSRLGMTVFVTQSNFSLLMQSRENYQTYHEIMRVAVQLRRSALEGKSPPASLVDFFPAARPRDRFTGEELVYRPGQVEGQYCLYSRGVNGTDDGAQNSSADWISQDDNGLIIYWNGL